MTDFWRDFVSITSALVTVVGFVLTVVSLVYAIKQIWKTQSAADAAFEAATRAVAESRSSFDRYVLSNALRYFAEAKAFVNSGLWDKASLRVGDLADQVAQLAYTDAGWKQTSLELRKWSETLEKASGPKSNFSPKKWGEFTRRLQEKFDELHGPFKDVKTGGEK